MGYMSAKGYITAGILFCGFIGFIVGVPSYDMIYLNPTTQSTSNTQPTFSYMGACDDSLEYQSHCASLSSDFWHCMNGDKNILTYHYDKLFWGFDPSSSQDSSSNFLDENFCQRILTCEAFGLMAIVLSFVSVVGSLHSKGRILGALSGITAALFGMIALAIFFSSKPEYFNNFNGVQGAHDSDISGFLTDGTFKLGYSTGLQIAGMAASFVGGCMALAVGDFITATDKDLPLAAAAAQPGHKSTGSVGGVEMH